MRARGVADLEFVQFHPTALNRPGAPRFLISEALRGEGARLVERARRGVHDAVPPGRRSRAARRRRAQHRARGRADAAAPVFLTLAHLDAAYVRQRFPTIAGHVPRVGLDLAHDPIPVGPAAHYIMGGVDTDEWGRTSLPGLFAAGEVACTGVHGANRLASNSLLEGLVFGARAAGRDAAAAGGGGRSRPDRREAAATCAVGELEREPATTQSGASDSAAVRDLMWRSVGLFRTRDGLRTRCRRLDAAYAIERDRVTATRRPTARRGGASI